MGVRVVQRVLAEVADLELQDLGEGGVQNCPFLFTRRLSSSPGVESSGLQAGSGSTRMDVHLTKHCREAEGHQ